VFSRSWLIFQKRANAFSFERPIKLGTGFFVGCEAIVPNGRSAFMVDDLKRPAFISLNEPVDLDADGDAVSSYVATELRSFRFQDRRRSSRRRPYRLGLFCDAGIS
jgi:hypothetical protein